MVANTVSELSDFLKGPGPFWIEGSGSRKPKDAGQCQTLSIKICGITMLSPEDLVCKVGAGTPMQILQNELAAVGLGLACSEANGTVGGAVSTNGTWRNLVLGMTLVRADGIIAKSGSNVVKSVAGYDAHKLFIGTYGAFGAISEVSLRVSSLQSLRGAPEPLACKLNETERMLLQRAKDIFDPTRKLNPGVLDLL